MSRDEITKGIANRFVHSQTYIVLYLVMAALSVTTVILSMVNDCPTLAFYVLEIIINGAMILEVGIRFVAFGRVSCACASVFAIFIYIHVCHAAILEIMVQCYGSGHHLLLCHHIARHSHRGL